MNRSQEAALSAVNSHQGCVNMHHCARQALPPYLSPTVIWVSGRPPMTPFIMHRVAKL